jgi:type IV secretory pathway TraG/TraD family ATPase VirD4
VAKYLDLNHLAILAREISDNKKRDSRFERIRQIPPLEIRGLVARLAALTESEIAHLFNATASEQSIDLNEAVEHNSVVVFSLNSAKFPEFTRLLGRLVVLDLKTVAGRMYDEKKKVFLIFDEFSVFATGAVVDLVGKTRSAGFCAVIATQSISDIDAATRNPAVVKQIIENCNTFIIQRQNSGKSAERLAGLIGRHESFEYTEQIRYSPRHRQKN